MQAMYERLGRVVARHWLLVIVGWIALVAVARWAAPNWDSITYDGDLAYMPDRMVSVQGEKLLRKAFPENRAKSQLVIACIRPEGRLTGDDLDVLDRIAEKFDEDRRPDLPIVGLWTPRTEVIGKKLTSRDGQAALIVLLVANEFMAIDNIHLLDAVQEVLDDVRGSADFPQGLQLEISGSAAIGGDTLRATQESIANTEVATIALVVIILLLVYRAPVLIAIPLITIALSIVVSLGLVAAATQLNNLPGFGWVDFKVFKTTKIFVFVILFGSGTDFCLFLISRFKEELHHGRQQADAVAAALGSVGEALAGSAMTTILGLGTMVFADFGKYHNSGPALSLCLAVTLLACLTLAPALLRAVGPIVFWPFAESHRPPATRQTATASAGETPAPSDAADDEPVSAGKFWEGLSRGIIARPGLILLTSYLLMAPLAYRGLHIHTSHDLTEELRPDRPSMIGLRLLRKHFPAGDLGPITILAEREGAEFDKPAGGRQIADLTRLLYNLPGVDSVRSLAEPLGDKPSKSRNVFNSEYRRKLAITRHPRTKAIYLAQAPQLEGDVTRLDVIPKDDPFSFDAIGVLDEIDRRLTELANDPSSAWYGTRFVYAGTTAGVRDLQAVTDSDQTLIQRLTVIAVLGVLIVILRRPVVCFYLIVTVLFSYLVTIGATEAIFSTLYQPFHGLDWKVPIFLFVILTAIGEDYNIYLVTRVLEEQRRRGLVEGLRVAVVRTGGIITSCGVIMAGTFISMMFGTLRGMLELGFALSLGVMLDTLVVRPVLVPAFLTLLYRRRERRERAPAAASAAAGHHARGEWQHRVGTAHQEPS